MIEELKTPVVHIKQAVDLSNHGILLLDSETLQDIYTKSGPLADNSEFQVHFWALVARYKFNDSILDIAIPTCFYNYKQEVSGAAIDFEMDDVSFMSAKSEPIHNMKVNELLNSKYKTILDNLIGQAPIYMATELNSIHRHPGGTTYQKFSSTDLKTNPDDLGVVFPYNEANNDYPTFAGIMALENKTNKLARCEYRTVNGKLRENIVYTKHRAVAVVSLPVKPLSSVEQLFGIQQPQAYYTTSDDGGSFAYEGLNNLLRAIGYKPSTDLISSENLTQKKYNIGGYYPKLPDNLDTLNLLSLTDLFNMTKTLGIKCNSLDKNDIIKNIKKHIESKSKPDKRSKNIKNQKLLPEFQQPTATKMYSRLELMSKEIDELIQIVISINYIYYGTNDSKVSVLQDFDGALDLKLDMIEYIEEVQGFIEDEEEIALNAAIKKSANTNPFYSEHDFCKSTAHESIYKDPFYYGDY